MNGVCPFATWIPGLTEGVSWQRGPIDPVGFCDHTAGGFLSTMRNPAFWNGAGVSTHFAIGRDGSIIQMVNIFDVAYAQGRLGPVVTWVPYNEMGRKNPNGYLISTEHEDAVSAKGQTRFIPGSEWTPAQYESDLRVKRWCVDEVRRVTGGDVLKFGIDSLAGHHMFDSVSRAECPGRFWREVYRRQLYSGLKDGGEVVDQFEEEQDRLRGALMRTLSNIGLPNRYILIDAGINPAHLKRVINIRDTDGSELDPPCYLAIRS